MSTGPPETSGCFVGALDIQPHPVTAWVGMFPFAFWVFWVVFVLFLFFKFIDVCACLTHFSCPCLPAESCIS